MFFKYKISVKQLVFATIFVTVFAIPFTASSQLQGPKQLLQLSTKNQQLEALNELIKMLALQYAPLEYKHELYGKTLDELYKKYAGMIESATTVDEHYGFVPKEERAALSPDQARYVLVALVSETHDGHAKILAPKRTYSGVGIRTVAINGKLYVSKLNTKVLKIIEQSTEPQVGDEIIAINGRDISYYKMRNLNYVNNGTIEARKDEALERILEVPHALLPPMAKRNEPVVITFARGGETFKNTYRWREINATEMTRPISPSAENKATVRQREDAPLVFGEKGNVRSYFFEGLLNLQKLINVDGQKKLRVLDFGSAVNLDRAQQMAKLTAQMTAGILNATSGNDFKKSDFETIIRKMQLSLGPVDRIKAYTIVGISDKPIAVIRIPSYAPPGGLIEVINEINFIQAAILRFQAAGIETLIIDQLSNPGGYTVYGHLLLSLLAPKGQKMTALKAQLLLTESLYNHYLQDSSILKDDPDQTVRRRFLRRLRQQMESGQRLSTPIPFSLEYDDVMRDEYGYINGRETSWAGKVVILADSRSASCGEIVPAILQDNNRALVFGELTMGLGFPLNGHVGGLNFSEMDFRCPFAICVRPNGEYIEGRGVKPNVLRNVTIKDLLTGFIHFTADALNTTLGYASGQTSTQIQLALNKLILERLNLQLTAEQKTVNLQVKTIRSNLKNRLLLLEKQLAENQTQLNLDDYLEAYNTFFTELSRLEQAGHISNETFDYTLVPLPKFLTDLDILLKDETRKDVVLRRLEEMLHLPKIKSRPELVLFIQEFRRRAMMVHGFYHFNKPCDKLFLASGTTNTSS